MTFNWKQAVLVGVVAGVGYAIGEKIVDAIWDRVFGGARA